MKLYSIGEFAREIGRTEQTLRNWDKADKFKPHHVSVGGTRYYSQDQLNHFLGTQSNKNVNKKVIGYCRVSSPKQKEELEQQIEQVKMYMIARGYQFEIISDIGSGMNYDKKGLNQLMDYLIKDEVEKVVILYKDRLMRFGFEFFENLCDKYGTSIEVIDHTDKIEEQELVDDLTLMVTTFSNHSPRKNVTRAKKLIRAFLEHGLLEKA